MPSPRQHAALAHLQQRVDRALAAAAQRVRTSRRVVRQHALSAQQARSARRVQARRRHVELAATAPRRVVLRRVIVRHALRGRLARLVLSRTLSAHLAALQRPLRWACVRSVLRVHINRRKAPQHVSTARQALTAVRVRVPRCCVTREAIAAPSAPLRRVTVHSAHQDRRVPLGRRFTRHVRPAQSQRALGRACVLRVWLARTSHLAVPQRVLAALPAVHLP